MSDSTPPTGGQWPGPVQRGTAQAGTRGSRPQPVGGADDNYKDAEIQRLRLALAAVMTAVRTYGDRGSIIAAEAALKEATT